MRWHAQPARVTLLVSNSALSQIVHDDRRELNPVGCTQGSRWRLGQIGECEPLWTRSTQGYRLSDLMPAFFSAPWPWYIAGPVIGLFVPALLIVGDRMFGVSSSLRHNVLRAPAR